MSPGAEPLHHRPRPAAGEPEGALVVLHGRGTDENDLAPLLDALDPKRRLVGATPRGPLSLPPGGAHWYVVREVGFPDQATFLPTYEQLAEWLDTFAADASVPIERTVLGGFSQGTAMSYALGLGAGRPRPAGILALSGFIPQVEGLELDLSKAAGADVTYRESPMGHSVDPDYLSELSGWVDRALERAPAGNAAAAQQPPP